MTMMWSFAVTQNAVAIMQVFHSQRTGAEIRDISDKNKVLVNGQEIAQALLLPGSVIQLGETQLMFNLLPGTSSNPLDVRDPNRGFSVAEDGVVLTPDALSRRNRKKSKARSSGPKAPFYILLAVLGTLIFMLVTHKPDTGPAPTGPRSEEEVLNTIEQNRKLVQSISEERRQAGQESQQYQEAQVHFTKVFETFKRANLKEP
jgi:pSer/pThr/pTyr-binding forkhead associated (FHA) protein